MIRNTFGRPTMDDVLNNLQDETLTTMNKANIGVIQSFDAPTQTATIQIQIKRIDSIALDGSVVYADVPVLANCPVFILFGGAGHLTFPIAKGDSCLVIFNDREIDQWFASGTPQRPITQRVHDIADGIALVGINSLKTLIANYLANGIRLALGADKIEITPAQIASFAALFKHTGNMQVTGGLQVDGTMTGNGGTINVGDDFIQEPGKVLSAGNGATGTFSTVTVVDGIVVSGTP